MTPKHCWGIPTDASAAMVAHGVLSTAMHINDDNDWPVHSLMLSIHDIHGLPLWRILSDVPCSMIYDSVSWCRHGRTMITCDAWWLTITVPDVWQGYRGAAIRIRTFYALRMIYQASPCSICSQRLGLASPDLQSASSSHIQRAVLTRWVICGI